MQEPGQGTELPPHCPVLPASGSSVPGAWLSRRLLVRSAHLRNGEVGDEGVTKATRPGRTELWDLEPKKQLHGLWSDLYIRYLGRLAFCSHFAEEETEDRRVSGGVPVWAHASTHHLISVLIYSLRGARVCKRQETSLLGDTKCWRTKGALTHTGAAGKNAALDPAKDGV